MFVHSGELYVVDNTLDRCRLIRVGESCRPGRVISIALSGKNLTFLPDDRSEPGEADLLLVHWFIPLKVFKVTLPADGEEPYARLECLYSAPPPPPSGVRGGGLVVDTKGVLQGTGPRGDDDAANDAAAARRAVPEGSADHPQMEGPRANEFRGGTPGRPAGPGVWWGLLHRTHMWPGGRLRHDPWAWVVRRVVSADGTGTRFEASLSRVEVSGRPPTSHVFDPCSILPLPVPPSGPSGAASQARGAASPVATMCLVTTAESESGWFAEQAFCTGVYRLELRPAIPEREEQHEHKERDATEDDDELDDLIDALDLITGDVDPRKRVAGPAPSALSPLQEADDGPPPPAADQPAMPGAREGGGEEGSEDASPIMATWSGRSPAHVRVEQDGHLGARETGGWVWEASHVLEAALLSDTTLDWDARPRVTELGAGTGYLSLRLASLGAVVTATDRRKMLGLMVRNVTLNQRRLLKADDPDFSLSVEVSELDWLEPPAELPSADLVVGSDLIYDDRFHTALVKVIRRFVLDERVRCVLSWEERKPDPEASFLKLAEDAGLAPSLLLERQRRKPHGEVRVDSTSSAPRFLVYEFLAQHGDR